MLKPHIQFLVAEKLSVEQKYPKFKSVNVAKNSTGEKETLPSSQYNIPTTKSWKLGLLGVDSMCGSSLQDS